MTNAIVGDRAGVSVMYAEMLALHAKTKHLQQTGGDAAFHEHYLLFGEQAAEILAASRRIEARLRSAAAAGGYETRPLRQPPPDVADAKNSRPEMIAGICADNIRLAAHLRNAHALCGRDVATARRLATLVDGAEGRVWSLIEAGV
jgi:hypothetical protein